MFVRGLIQHIFLLLVFFFVKNKFDLKIFRGLTMFFYGIGVPVNAFEGIRMALPRGEG